MKKHLFFVFLGKHPNTDSYDLPVVFIKCSLFYSALFDYVQQKQVGIGKVFKKYKRFTGKMGNRYNDKEQGAEVDCDQGGKPRHQEEGTNCSLSWLRNVRSSHSNSKVESLCSLFSALAGVSASS